MTLRNLAAIQSMSWARALLLILLSLLNLSVWAQSECKTIRDCYYAAKNAEENEKFSLSYSKYARACTISGKESHIAFKYSSCNKVIALSGETDNFKSAEDLFSKLCKQGNEDGCFFRGKLEESKGNLPKAMEIMESLCDRGFSHPGVAFYDACDVLEQLQYTWSIKHPEPPKPSRSGPLQWIAFFTVLLLPLISWILINWTKISKSPVGNTILIALSLVAFLAYGYYESGISPRDNIRIDLLLILPALILSFAQFVNAVRKWAGSNKETATD